MELSVIIGSFGVVVLLVAFFLNLFGIIATNNKWYPFLNFLGAGISGVASYMIHYTPFLILEIIWTLVALIALINLFLKK